MREIKFRGMTIESKWVYGLLCITEGNTYISNSVGRPMAYQVRPETVGQFLGVKDRNEKEIFENDIIKAWSDDVDTWQETNQLDEEGDQIEINTTSEEDKITFAVEYSSQGGYFMSQEINGEYVEPVGSDTAIVEVIGNVFEHPHLLTNSI